MLKIYAKLAQVQKGLKAIAKTETNPFFKSKYYDINSLLSILRPLLNDVGLVVLQPLVQNGVAKFEKKTKYKDRPNDKENILESEISYEIEQAGIQTIVFDPASGEKIEFTTPLIITTDIQKQGAMISYLRRYALTSLFLLEAEDDDGNSASKKTIQANKICKTCKKSFAPKAGMEWAEQCYSCFKKEKEQPVEEQNNYY